MITEATRIAQQRTLLLDERQVLLLRHNIQFATR